MTLGEINKSDLLDSENSLHPFESIANILMVIFLFLMPMVLINLTVRRGKEKVSNTCVTHTIWLYAEKSVEVRILDTYTVR